MLTLPILRKMLLNAAVELKANSTYLCELDSVAGDGDHGITIGRMADVMKTMTEEDQPNTMHDLLDELGDAFMGINGGSAGPLWGTIFSGMAEGIEDQAELTELEFRKMFVQAKEDFMDISKAQVGDKTMVDALYPALDTAIAAHGTLKEIMDAAAARQCRAPKAPASWWLSLGVPKIWASAVWAPKIPARFPSLFCSVLWRRLYKWL